MTRRANDPTGSLLQVLATTLPALQALRFGPPVACVYNPLEYARELHEAWLQRYGQGAKEVLLLGMNPGPFGMVQTGVPFGEVAAVRGWLGLSGTVRAPAQMHAKRPVEGLACRRSEVSGRRLWGWAAQRWGKPERFFRHFFVHNYCPLAFAADSGANLTPDKLPRSESAPLFAICDRMLQQTVAVLRPRVCIGIGAFAEQRLRQALAGMQWPHGMPEIGRMPHPSPASPAANRGWEALADAALRELGLADLGL